MDAKGYYANEFHRPSPYQSPDTMSPFRMGFLSQRSTDSPMANGYNSSRTSYQDYPTSRRADQYGPLKSRVANAEVVHETNSKAVVNALKSLQEKIRRLELDRVKAEDNLKSLASEANEYKTILQKEHEFSETTQSAIEQQKKDLEEKLLTAEDKCQLLEKQLMYMRKMTEQPEPERLYQNAGYTRPGYQKQVPETMFGVRDRAFQAEKLAELERSHIKLTASQTLAESKIRELEEKLQEERHQRKILQDRAAELQTLAATNRILLNMTSPEDKKPKRTTKKKKAVKKAAKPKRTSHESSTPPSHYRLNMGSIPFVVGKSTAKSYALGANIQNVLSLMKSHNPQLCNAATRAQRKYHVTGSTSSTDAEGIGELITQLQDEFGHMGFEHSELVKQIQETTDVKLREDFERELDRLVSRMETKGEQIATLKQHERKHAQERRNKATSAQNGSHRRSMSLKGSEVEVVTTIKTKSKSPKTEVKHGNAQIIDSSPSRGPNNLQVFKKVQKLQGTLRQDDLSWD
eukprot:gene473-1118_t